MIENLFELSQEFLQEKKQNYRRYFIKTHDLSEKFAILIGQRGIGKTTLLIQYLLDYVNNDVSSTKIIYIQADHFSLGKTSLYEIANRFYLMGGEFIVFDEIHKYPNWSIELKSITDTFGKLKIIASGSSALEIHKGSHDLSRRALVYSIVGMSFREYLELTLGLEFTCYELEDLLENHFNLATSIVEKLQSERILSHFSDYLKFGYYPYYNEYHNIAKFNMTLEQNIHTTLESDLTSIYPHLTGNSIMKIKLFLSYLAQSAPFTPNWSQLKKILEIGDERTLKTYFKYLLDAQLIATLYKSSKLLDQIDAPSKIYLQNPNLMHSLAKENKTIGTCREIFFYNMLSLKHKITLPLNGDFLVDNKYVFEVGGAKKSMNPIKSCQHPYIASDHIEKGFKNKIPLWLFGFLY